MIDIILPVIFFKVFSSFLNVPFGLLYRLGKKNDSDKYGKGLGQINLILVVKT